QKRAGNFFGSEGANLTQGQSCANVEAQRGMTTREDQPEHIVLNLLVYVRWIRRIRFHLPYLLHLQGIKFRLATETVDCLKPSGRNKPCPGVGGNAIFHPLLKGCLEGVLQCVFSQVEVAKQADQRGKNSARI